MTKLKKVNVVTLFCISQCYVLKIVNDIYYVMDCKTYDSRPWGDPPYWESKEQCSLHNYHQTVSKDFICDTQKSTLQLQNKLLQNYWEQSRKDLLAQKQEIENEIYMLDVNVKQRIKENERILNETT